MSSRNLLDIRKREVRRVEKRRPLPLKYEPPKAERLRTRRRRQRMYMACICIMGAAGLVGGLSVASHMEKFAINTISVTGAEQLSSDALSASVQAGLQDGGFRLFSRKNMFLYPKKTIESELSATFPRIKGVSVARESLLAQAVVVAVEERKSFAKWCDASATCFVMDESGFIYAPLGETPMTPYVFRGGLIPHVDVVGQFFLHGRIRGIVSLLADLEKEGFKARGVTVDSEKDFTILLEGGPYLLASFEMVSGDIIRNLKTALEADSLRGKMDSLEYIDLRFGNRVYYK